MILNKIFNNKIYVFFGVVIFLLASVYFTVTTNKRNVQLFFHHNDQISILMELDHNFNNFISSRSELYIFDKLNGQIDRFKEILGYLKKEAQKAQLEQNYIDILDSVEKEFGKKEIWLERYKARKAFESNIIAFILDRSNTQEYIKDENTLNKLNNIRIDLLENIQHSTFTDIDIVSSYDLKVDNSYMANFVNQVNVLQKSMLFQNRYYKESVNKNINTLLHEAKNLLLEERLKTKQTVFVVLNVLFALIALFLVVFLLFYRKLSITKEQLTAFKKAVENSDNVIVMTDKNSRITYANDAFEKTTGYPKSQVLGKNPSILKSGLQDSKFYEDLNKTINQGKTWRGRFINKKSSGEVFYENASISPIYSHGEIEGYLAIKLDVTESVLHAQELDELNKSLEERVQKALKEARVKDRILLEQTKMANLGEMIGNIAHQWRQPLSAISSGISSMQLQKQIGILEDKDFGKTCDIIIENTNYLSKTIDDFRNFIKGEGEKELFNLKKSIDSFLSLVSTSTKKYYINIVTQIPEELQIETLKNELNQCLINLYNNSKDILVEKNIQKKYIYIKAEVEDEVLRITFQDNGGGIDEDIISRIFEPYFTTKHQSIGTGLGLSMTYRLIVEAMKGEIRVTNDKFYIGKEKFYGAKFSVKIPLNLK